MNRERITKVNHLLTQTEICSRGGMFSRLISKGFISNLINKKDYEITSRNTRDFFIVFFCWRKL